MFNASYHDWNQKRIKGIVDNYGYKFFFGKKILDLGCGYGDLGGVLHRLGADITAVDVRQDHLKVVTKKFPGIKVVKTNLEAAWAFNNQKFDLILDLGLLCHLSPTSFENHLKTICNSTTYLILETAVCDSNDPNKCLPNPEAKEVYDLSFNGMGCRPSPANIERVLSECGMTFKRLDQSKYNSGEYIYDWQAKNDNHTNIGKRRMWFAVKTNADSQAVTAPFINFNMSSGAPIVLNGVPAQTNIAPQIQPMMDKILSDNILPKRNQNISVIASHYTESQVAKNSREFALINFEKFEVPATFQTSGTIFPNSLSSRMWFKKIAPFFPNIKLYSKALSMFGFNKTNDTPNIIMCSINNLIAANRIWVEEWSDNIELNNSQIDILNQCQNIMTPSLLNIHQILKALPNANISRIERPWAMLNINSHKDNYFIYLEKNPKFTSILLDTWNVNWGKLYVVGSSVKLPPFATYVSNGEDYPTLLKYILGSKAIIDLSDNTYYMSGLLNLAKAYHVPVITNNTYKFDDNSIIPISQDKRSSIESISQNINHAMQKILNNNITNTAQFDANHNNTVNNILVNLLGI